MFVLSQGKVEKLVRELDADFAIQIIIETVKAI